MIQFTLNEKSTKAQQGRPGWDGCKIIQVDDLAPGETAEATEGIMVRFMRAWVSHCQEGGVTKVVVRHKETGEEIFRRELHVRPEPLAEGIQRRDIEIRHWPDTPFCCDDVVVSNESPAGSRPICVSMTDHDLPR